MRELKTTLAGKPVSLAATFKASMEIAEEVTDPLYISREIMVEYTMQERGIPYTPRWMFTVQNIPLILHIGMKAAGSTLTVDKVQEMVFEEGFANSRDIATEYLGLIVGPAPEEELEGEEESEGK